MQPILAAVLLAQAPALHPPPCGLAPFMGAALAQYHERPVAEVDDATGRKVQLWISEGWATWSVTATDRAGTMCILSAGQGRPTLPGTPS